MKRVIDVSYLAPRDPSIFSFNGRPMPRKQNLTFGDDEIEETSSTVKVFLRVKPHAALEVGPEVPSFKIVGTDKLTTTSLIRQKQVVQQFKFTSVLPEGASQRLVFDSVARRPLQALITSQRSGLIFTYGTTNAGKTYTMFGDEADPGLIPLSLSALFSSLGDSLLPGPRLKPSDTGVSELGPEERNREMELRLKLLEWDPKLGEDTYSISMMSGYQAGKPAEPALPRIPLHTALRADQRANVWISCLEVYQEQAFDLLAPNQSALSLRGDGVRGLTVVSVETAADAQRLLLLAQHRLRSARTGLNMRSSRSHCVFTVRIAVATQGAPHSHAQFDFVDLAGSERADKTGNQGLRLVESSKINQSLSVLGRCLKAMRANQKGGNEVVPFRDSLLTRLLKTSLRGECVSLLVCASPDSKTFPETTKALEFASIARRVQLRLPPREASLVPSSRFSLMAVARPAASGWLAPQPPKQTMECAGCLNAEKTLALRLMEQETRLRIELVDQFSVLLKDEDERYKRNLESQEARMMKLMRHREKQMQEILAAQGGQTTGRGGKRTRTQSTDLSDSESDGGLDSAVAEEITQLREDVNAAAKTVAEAEFRAAHAERQLQEVLSGAAGESSEGKVCELNSLLDEARDDHLRDQQQIERLQNELQQALEDAALKEIQLDEAAISLEELEKVADLKASQLDQRAEIATLETTTKEQKEMISALQSAEAELKEKILAYNASEDELVEKMAALETSNLETTARLKAMEERFSLQTTELLQLRDKADQDSKELATLRQQAASVDSKENKLEQEVKRLLQDLRALSTENNAVCADMCTMKAALVVAEEKNRSLVAENAALATTMEQQQREYEESNVRHASLFAQMEDSQKRDREAAALAKRDAAAATAQLYRVTPARRQRSLSMSNAGDAKENSAVAANSARPETRSSKRLTQRPLTVAAPVGDGKKANRKLFVQKECESLEPSPEHKPRTRSGRK